MDVSRSAAALAIALAICSTASAPQQNRAHHFGPGECGPADPTYIQLATETGGQPFFLNPSEAAKSIHFMRETSGSSTALLLWSSGTLDHGAQELTALVDTTVRRVTFSLSVDTAGTDLAVSDPSGTSVVDAGSRVEVTALNCGRVVTIDLPPPGLWHLRVRGAGRYWLTVDARTDLSLVDVEFVKPGGRPAHEGLFRIHGQPVRGTPALLRVVVSREHARTAAFDLVSLRGDRLATLAAHAADGDSPEEFVMPVDLPAEPFRLRVHGVDEGGAEYARVYQTLFHAESVEVTPPDEVDDLPPAGKTAVRFTVRNAGSTPATFRMMAADGRRFVSRFEPETLALDAGATGTVTVWIAVPADAGPGTGTDLTLTATSLSAPATSNGAVRHIAVSAAR